MTSEAMLMILPSNSFCLLKEGVKTTSAHLWKWQSSQGNIKALLLFPIELRVQSLILITLMPLCPSGFLSVTLSVLSSQVLQHRTLYSCPSTPGCFLILWRTSLPFLYYTSLEIPFSGFSGDILHPHSASLCSITSCCYDSFPRGDKSNIYPFF